MIAAAEQPTSLHEIAFGSFVAKRSNGAETDNALTQALTACSSAGIEVVSVLPEWVELRVPCDNPFHHAFVREKKGLRGGGFGILLANQLVDDLVYNERHNEVLFVKYLS
jgi:hypothetical protein